VFGLLLRATRFGLHTCAIGSNESAALLCGVPVARTKVLVYAIGVGCAGIAAVLQLSYLSMGDPTTAEGTELQVIAAAVLGGASLSGGRAGSSDARRSAPDVRRGERLHAARPRQLGPGVRDGAIIVAAVALDRLRHRP
jgi:ribose/xylose/arabinose/galactoside ABC-type transport system permease subunit